MSGAVLLYTWTRVAVLLLTYVRGHWAMEISYNGYGTSYMQEKQKS